MSRLDDTEESAFAACVELERVHATRLHHQGLRPGKRAGPDERVNLGERIIDRVPLIRRVYPAVKQVTDFFFGDNDEEKLKSDLRPALNA